MVVCYLTSLKELYIPLHQFQTEKHFESLAVSQSGRTTEDSAPDYPHIRIPNRIDCRLVGRKLDVADCC